MKNRLSSVVPHPQLWRASYALGWDHVSCCVVFYVVTGPDAPDAIPPDFSFGNRFIRYIDDDTIDLVRSH